MRRVVLDADVFIDHLKGKTENFKTLVEKGKAGDLSLFIPTAVLVEIFVGYEFLKAKERRRAERLLQPFQPLPLTKEVALLAAKMGREKKLASIGTIDLVIAATALIIEGEVATHNVKHFKDIPNLKLFAF